MRASPECIACSLQQVIRIASRITEDENVHERLIRRGLDFLREQSLDQTPADLSSAIFHFISGEMNSADPFGPEKESYNREAMNLCPWLRELIAAAPDPLRIAALAAVAGNLIDLGIMAGVVVEEAVRRVLDKGFARADLDKLKSDLSGARNLLYIGDNAGEIAFDRLLAEEIKREYPDLSITFAVKSGPCMNDATREDAEAVGMGEAASIIETGGAYMGVSKRFSSPEFWEAFESADVVIAKGHANCETLDDVPHRALYFLVTVKCPRVSRALGVAEGGSVLIKSHAGKAE